MEIWIQKDKQEKVVIKRVGCQNKYRARAYFVVAYRIVDNSGKDVTTWYNTLKDAKERVKTLIVDGYRFMGLKY